MPVTGYYVYMCVSVAVIFYICHRMPYCICVCDPTCYIANFVSVSVRGCSLSGMGYTHEHVLICVCVSVAGCYIFLCLYMYQDVSGGLGTEL